MSYSQPDKMKTEIGRYLFDYKNYIPSRIFVVEFIIVSKQVYGLSFNNRGAVRQRDLVAWVTEIAGRGKSY